MSDLKEVLAALVKHFTPEEASMGASAFVAMFGAISNYIYQVQMGKRSFDFLKFLLTCFLGLYIGVLVGEFLPKDMPYRDGWLSVAGFSMYQIYYVLDVKGGALVRKLFDKVLNK